MLSSSKVGATSKPFAIDTVQATTNTHITDYCFQINSTETNVAQKPNSSSDISLPASPAGKAMRLHLFSNAPMVEPFLDSIPCKPADLASQKQKQLTKPLADEISLFVSEKDGANEASLENPITDKDKPEKALPLKPVNLSFNKATKKGEGKYYFNNNYMIKGARGYCDGMTNLFLQSFLQTVKNPENKKQTKLAFLEDLRISVTPFDMLKKLVDKKPYSLHSDRLADKYMAMQLTFMSKAIDGQLGPDFIPCYFNRVGQIACYPKDMLKSLIHIINFMKLNQLNYIGLKLIISQHAMGMFIVRDEKKSLYVVYTMDPNEGARYKRTEIADEQLNADFYNSTVFNFLSHNLLQDRLVNIDCLVDKEISSDNLHSLSLVNQIFVKSLPFFEPGVTKELIQVMTDILFQAVATNNLQLLEFGIKLINNYDEIYDNFPIDAVQKNGGNLAASLTNYAMKLKYEDIAITLIKGLKVPALSLGLVYPEGNILRFLTADRKELDTPLETAVRAKIFKIVKLLLDTDIEINTTGFELNDTHKIGTKIYFKKTIERYLREQPKLVEYAKIKLSLVD